MFVNLHEGSLEIGLSTFRVLIVLQKSSYVLGSEAWEDILVGCLV